MPRLVNRARPTIIGRGDRTKSFGTRLTLECLESRQLLSVSPSAPDTEPMTLYSLSSVPVLNSLPGAAAALYLDFNSNTAYMGEAGGYVFTPAFDLDGDESTFNNAELEAIEFIWSSVAEDFAPFNINITTVEPPMIAGGIALRAAIGGASTDWYDPEHPGSAAGVSFSLFAGSSVTDKVVHVFAANPLSLQSVANITSHELGHTMFLGHSSVYDSSNTVIQEYYSGPQNGDTAPIMGAVGDNRRGLWWHGRTSMNAALIQDDMARISNATNGFGYRSDDHGNAIGTATALTPVGDAFEGSGIITQTADSDYFSFEQDAIGRVTIAVTVPEGINNLDSQLELRDSTGQLVQAAAPTDDYGATIVADLLTAGTYYVVVKSQGNYGDVGQYAVKVSNLPPTGRVFLDSDRDGAIDGGEPGISGWTIYEDANGNGAYDAAPHDTFDSTDTPLAIVADDLTYSYLTVGDVNGVPAVISDVNVRVSITNPNVTVSLIAPDGTVISLIRNHFDGIQPTTTRYIDTWFDDEASDYFSTGTSPYTASFRPDNDALSMLDGHDPNGVWRLEVVPGWFDTGEILDWSIDITTTGERAVESGPGGYYYFPFQDSDPHVLRQIDESGYVQTGPPGGFYSVVNPPGTPATGNDFGNAPPAVVGRHIFYNQSAFDGGSSSINSSDDAAIATDKSPYIPGAGTAVAANATNYSRGINGIMVDVFGATGTLTLSDFQFKVGNNNAPGSWSAAPTPSAFSVRAGAGVNGSDRVEFTWAHGDIQNAWLEVQVLATANTGLPSTDVHFWGNKTGDSASSSGAGTFETTSTDAAEVFLSIGSGKPITDLWDYNRDGQVSSSDAATVFANIGTIVRLNVSAGGPFAPEGAPMAVADNGGHSAVAFALGSRGVEATPDSPAPVHSLTQPLPQDTIGRPNPSAVVASARHFEALTATSDAIDDIEVDDELCAPLLAALL